MKFAMVVKMIIFKGYIHKTRQLFVKKDLNIEFEWYQKLKELQMVNDGFSMNRITQKLQS